MELQGKTLIFTDGACSGNPGPGGYGTIIVFSDDQVRELGGGASSTTNNRMELQAVIEGLQATLEIHGETWVLTDSTYVIRGITQWIWGWKKKGWKNAAGADVANEDLWKILDALVFKKKQNSAKIEWKYIRGHQGNPGNERCDEIAVEYSKGRKPALFKGSLNTYTIAIHDLPENMSLPMEKKTDIKKKKAYSYLSYVNGNLQRHQTWSECEAVVKGRPGAKFKKSSSAEDEKSIVKSWGLSDKDLPRP